MGKLEGKVILVTGAGKGVGRLLAESFARQGAHLAVNDISPVNLDVTVAHIQAAGGCVKSYVEDIAKKMTVQVLLNSVLADFGHLDILVNAADVEPQSTVLEMDDWDWQRTLDVNLTGAFLLTQCAGRIMKDKGDGIILHVGARLRDSNRRSAYLTSKAGLEALVRTAQAEYQDYGIQLLHLRPEGGNIEDKAMQMILQSGDI